MSIRRATGQTDTITDGLRALSLFTDQRAAIHHFASYLNDDPPRKQILFFHGDGGNGKSLLLRYLREHCCKILRREEWEYVASLEDEERFKKNFESAHAVAQVPYALLDFDVPAHGDERPQDPFYAPLMLRRALGGHGLHFPLYDFAVVWYLRKTGQASDAEIKNLFPDEELGLVTEIIDAITQDPVASLVKAIFTVFDKHIKLGKRFWDYMRQRKLDETEMAKITRMDPEKELRFNMPRIFADALNAAMTLDNTPRRVVLFFDTHEALWGSEREVDAFSRRDAWLRDLLASLEFGHGVVAVIAGRNRPRWSGNDVSGTRIPKAYIDCQLVGNLPREDALRYLRNVAAEYNCPPLADPAMGQALVTYAQVAPDAPDEIHPLYLGLCADVVIAANADGTTLTLNDFRAQPQRAIKEADLLQRLLKYVDADINYAVTALSAARAFDRDIHRVLGAALNFRATEPDFRTLTAFSFVRRLEGREGEWYQVHQLLRRLVPEYREEDREMIQRAHATLDAHFRALAESGVPNAIAEAIYHANRQDWERGVREWIEVFESALEMSRLGLCGALLGVRGELSIETDFRRGCVSQSEGDYFALLARHTDAETEYLEAIAAYNAVLQIAPDDMNAHNNKGLALGRLGDLQASLSDHDGAMESYRHAIATYETALRLAPDFIYAHNNKGLALQSLGDLQARLSDHNGAMESYRSAIAAYETALRLAPDFIYAHNNKGVVLHSLGDLQATLTDHAGAMDSYRNAIATYETALRLAPDDPQIHNNQGIVQRCLGDLQATLSDHAGAMESYRRAIATYETALRLAPDYPQIHSHKGNALQSLGALQARRSDHAGAMESYRHAIATYETALRLAPDDIAAHNNKGSALERLGALQARCSDHVGAMDSYRRAIATYEIALRLAPDDIGAHNNKGSALTSLGKLQASLSDHAGAMESYQRAIATYETALRLAPDDIFVHNNKGVALQSLGKLQATLSDPDGAIESYRHAIATYETALRLAPDDPQIHNNQGIVQYCLGDLQATLTDHAGAMESYRSAIAIYETALRRAPDDTYAHNNKGNALCSLGELQASLSDHDGAMDSYRHAIAAYETALRLAPDYINAHTNKGVAQALLGVLQVALEQPERAQESWEAALAAFSRSLEIAPNDGRVRGLRDAVQAQIDALRAALEEL